MTRVYCTKKLNNFVGDVEETLPDDFNDIRLSDWNAHLFFVDKRKCIVFVNILTYYSVFITNIVKKDLKDIDKIFMMRLNEQLLHDRVIVDFNNTIPITDRAKIIFIKTNNNKKVIGRINDFVAMFKVHCSVKYGHLNEMDIVYENGLFNRSLTGQYADIKKTMTNPVENLKEIMKTSTQQL